METTTIQMQNFKLQSPAFNSASEQTKHLRNSNRLTKDKNNKQKTPYLAFVALHESFELSAQYVPG